jgi:hypothetical protein
MSFKPIRTFLTERLLEIDPEFEAYDQAFPNNEIGFNDYNKRFHIFYGDVVTSSANQNTTNDVVSASVQLFFQGARTSTEALDEAMDIANKYRLNCLKRINYAGLIFIKNVVSTSIKADPVDPTNDNQIKISLQFSISVIFGTDVDLNC